MQETKVASVLRVSLDDAQPSVVRAAAQALAVLVGPDPEVESTWQTADLNPVTCMSPSNTHCNVSCSSHP